MQSHSSQRTVIIAAAGDCTLDGDLVSLFASADVVVAADRGLHHCVAADRWPDHLVGDFDSADPAVVAQAREAGVTVSEFDPDKDQTDLELAFAVAAGHGPDEIVVVGAFGGRLDHELANVALLASPHWPCAVRCIDGTRSMWVLHGDRRDGDELSTGESGGGSRASLELTKELGTTLTLLPWNGDATGVVTRGLRWPLRGETLQSGSPRGVSNECSQARQHISIESGSLLVVCG